MKKFLTNRDFILFAIIMIGLVAVGFANPLFVTPSSISDVLTDTSILIILALSQMIVILIRAIDLSVASNLALSGMLISLLSTVHPELPVYYFIALSCVIGTVLGSIEWCPHRNFKSTFHCNHFGYFEYLSRFDLFC